MARQGYNDRLDESLGMRNGKESMMSQSYKARRDESRGMRSEANKANERYMPSGMSGKVMGHDKAPKGCDPKVGMGWSKVKPFREGKGYPKQAYDYKY